jgi:hypothetical protein
VELSTGYVFGSAFSLELEIEMFWFDVWMASFVALTGKNLKTHREWLSQVDEQWLGVTKARPCGFAVREASSSNAG